MVENIKTKALTYSFASAREKGLLSWLVKTENKLKSYRDPDLGRLFRGLKEYLYDWQMRPDMLRAPTIESTFIRFSNRLKEKSRLGKTHEYLLKLMIFYSLNNEPTFVNSNKSYLLKILQMIENNEESVTWMYKIFISYLDQSQLRKLSEAYFGKNYENPLSIDNQKIMIQKLIDLFHIAGKVILKGDSASFLALDMPAREASCWKELEFARSKNDDYSRIAAAINYKHWLFKEPVLQEFCRQKRYDLENLNFTQKAELTKKCLMFFSKEKIIQLIDEATERDLNLIKQKLTPETNEALINKRVSLGMEREIGLIPFELATIYAWYENLDRSMSGDEMVYKDEFQAQFQLIGKMEDNKKLVSFYQKNLDLIIQCMSMLDDEKNKNEKIVDQKVQGIILSLPEDLIKLNFQNWLKQNTVDMQLLEMVKKYLQLKLQSAELDVQKYHNDFKSNLIQTRSSKESEKNYKSLTRTKYLAGKSSNLAKKTADVFLHHMEQIQAIGHELRDDAYSEYALAYTSGRFKNPYRVNLRESWELYKNLFYDVSLEEMPLHITMGWVDDAKNRNVAIYLQDAIKDASVLNFALMATGWTNPKFIETFKQAKDSSKQGLATISSITDTGRSRLIRARVLSTDSISSTEGRLSGLEFRGFSPGKGLDQVRLLAAFGTLGTAMKSHLFVESLQKNNPMQVDQVDEALSHLWTIFCVKVEEIYSQYGEIPSLFNTDLWLSKVIDEHGMSVENKEFDAVKISRFYNKLIEEQHKENGLVAQMKQLIAQTTQQIEAVFKEPSELVSDPSSEPQPTPPTP